MEFNIGDLVKVKTMDLISTIVDKDDNNQYKLELSDFGGMYFTGDELELTEPDMMGNL